MSLEEGRRMGGTRYGWETWGMSMEPWSRPAPSLSATSVTRAMDAAKCLARERATRRRVIRTVLRRRR